MNTNLINNILTITLIGLILTSNANAQSGCKVDKNIAEIQKNSDMIAAVIASSKVAQAQNGGFQKVSYQQTAPLFSGLKQVDEQSHAVLKVLESDGILSSAPVSQLQQLNGKNLGRVVMLNKCFAISARHHAVALAGEQNIPLTDGQKFYGSFGRSCDGKDKDSGEFHAAGVEMSVFATDKMNKNPEDWVVLKISNTDKAKLNGFQFANVTLQEIPLYSDLLIGGVNADNIKVGLRYSGLHAVKYQGGSIDEGLITDANFEAGGKSGGGVYFAKNGKLYLAGVHLKEGFANPIGKMLATMISQKDGGIGEAKAKELFESLKNPNCY